jgi:hypothetical protein
MRYFLLATLLLLSVNAFSQSYIVLNNGVTLTLDKEGFIYDFGHFRIPYKISTSGGHFLVSENKISTLDKNGFLYEKDEKIKEVKGSGLNYLLIQNNDLLTIDEDGYIFKYNKNRKVFRKIHKYGGNYFTVKPKRKRSEVHLYTVNSKGNYSRILVKGLDPSTIVTYGGTFFQTSEHSIFTVSKDGYVIGQSTEGIGYIKRSAGNFFFDSNDKLFTISESGQLLLPDLPESLNLNDIQKIGANYMLDSEGRVFVVDSAGNIFERFVEHDLNDAKIISF